MKTMHPIEILHPAVPRIAALALAFACLTPHRAQADAGAVYTGLPHAVAGRHCGDPGSVSIRVQGGALHVTEAHGPAFEGALQPDSSFRLLPVPEQILEKRLLAPPVLEGRVGAGAVSGVITSRWCTYRFDAGRNNPS